MYDGTLKFDTKIDDSGFSVGLDKIGSIAKAGFAAVGALSAAAVAGIAAVGSQAISTGKDFTKGMSQVGATLGYSVSEMQDSATAAFRNMEMLTAKAEEMGAKTAFSASQAAEGLNILAQSGYNAAESAEMINSVLDMAAAGGLGLGTAASYISGSMKGFTKEAGNFADNAEASAYYSDLIAKGATLANTSVQQLGEALSGASSTANTYGQSARSTEVALLRLAEQNEVGSAAATALAAAMKNLYSPTEQAKQVLDKLGVSAYDAKGKARDFNNVVDDLKEKLYSIQDESERNNLENAIFGIQGQAAFDKMVSSSADKVQSFYSSLDYTEEGALGSAAKQAEAMLDNLEGDLTILGSAFDGLKIKIFKNLDSPLRDAVQHVTGYLSDMTDAAQANGMEGLVTSFGDKIPEAIDYFAGYLPKIADIGSRLIITFADGAVQNLPKTSKILADTAGKMISAFIKALPELIVTGVSAAAELAKGIADGLPVLLQSGETLLSDFAAKLQKKKLRFDRLGKTILKSLTKAISKNLPLLTSSILDFINGAVDFLTDSGNLSAMADGAVSLLLALADGLIQSVPVLIEKIPEIITSVGQGIRENAHIIQDSGKKILEQLGESLKNAKDTLAEHAPEIMENLKEALLSVPLALGAVADAVISAVADALGLGDKWQAVKDKVSEMFGSLDFEELKLQLKTKLELLTEKAETIRQKISEKIGEIDLEELKLQLKTSLDFIIETAADLKEKISEKLSEIDFEKLKQTISVNLQFAVEDIPETVKNNLNIFLSTTAEAAERLNTSLSNLKTAREELQKSFQPLSEKLGLSDETKEFLSGGGIGKMVGAKIKGDLTAPFMLITILIDAVSRLALGVSKLTKNFAIFGSCVVDTLVKAEEKMELFGGKVYDIIENARQWGKDLVDNFLGGAKEKWDEWANTWEDFGGCIYDLLHHSTPEKGPLKDDDTWMPDMMRNFREGIRKHIPSVTRQAEQLTNELHSALEDDAEFSVKAPDFGFPENSVPELPSEKIPAPPSVFSELALSPDLLQYFQKKSLRLPDFLGTSNPVTHMIQNQYYSSHTENQTVQTSDSKPISITLHSNVELDHQAFGNAVEKFIVDTNAGYGGAFI